MAKPIQISIPKPCHESWENMTPVEKGRFCASCQKQVYDFTFSSDKEIASILKREKNACGRFRINQLERNLIIPKEKNKFWIAASSAVIAFIGLGRNEVLAQETEVKTELHEAETSIEKESISVQKSFISGIVSDIVGSLPNASVINKTTKQETSTDIDGKYIIEASEGDIIQISYVSFITQEIKVENCTNTYDVFLQPIERIEVVMDVYGRPELKRTFFGRIFHSIGNWFR